MNIPFLEKIYLIDVLVGIIFEYWLFSKISLVKRSKTENIYFVCLTAPVLIYIYLSSWVGNELEQFVEIILLYFFYRKSKNDYQTLGRLMIMGAIPYIIYPIMLLVINILNINFSIIQMISFDVITYIVLYMIIMKTNIIRPLDRENDKDGKVYFWLVVYIFVTSVGINYISYFIKAEAFVSVMLIVFFAVQMFFVIYLYRTSQKVTKDKLFLQQMRDLKTYTQQLEENQRNLRKFKHDYQNMLLSLQLSAKSRHDKELVAKLSDYSNTHLNSKVLWHFDNIDNIKDELLKSLLISKLNTIFQQKIEHSFECLNTVEKIQDINFAFDIIRILGIAYDNAIEASVTLNDKAKISSMVYSVGSDLEFEIKNRFDHIEKTILELKKPGVTTKSGHAGYGLANIDEIKSKYDNILVEYRISDNWFTFVMSISGL